MVKVKEVKDAKELKKGQTLLTVDLCYNEALDYVDCIDNGYIYTVSAWCKTDTAAKEELDTYLINYHKIFIVE